MAGRPLRARPNRSIIESRPKRDSEHRQQRPIFRYLVSTDGKGVSVKGTSSVYRIAVRAIVLVIGEQPLAGVHTQNGNFYVYYSDYTETVDPSGTVTLLETPEGSPWGVIIVALSDIQEALLDPDFAWVYEHGRGDNKEWPARSNPR